MRLKSAEFAIRSLCKVTEQNVLVFVGFYVAIAGILCGEVVERELVIKGTVNLPEIGVDALGIDRLEIE